MVTIQALDMGVSNHTLLLLDTRTLAFTGNGRHFKLELALEKNILATYVLH
jgi:hypothetical protein